MLLSSEPGLVVVGTARDATEAIWALRALEEPADLILIDVSEAAEPFSIRRVGNALPGSRVIALEVEEREEEILAHAEAGAVAYVTRDRSCRDLVDVIESAARGEAVYSPAMTGALLRRVAALASGNGHISPVPALTARESQILLLIERGLSNKQIASRLSVELSTVKNHVHRILGKIGVEHRAAAAAWVRAGHRIPS